MNSGHLLIVQSKMSQLQEQAQGKDAEVHRQQRELQALRVRLGEEFMHEILLPV